MWRISWLMCKRCKMQNVYKKFFKISAQSTAEVIRSLTRISLSLFTSTVTLCFQIFHIIRHIMFSDCSRQMSYYRSVFHFCVCSTPTAGTLNETNKQTNKNHHEVVTIDFSSKGSRSVYELTLYVEGHVSSWRSNNRFFTMRWYEPRTSRWTKKKKSNVSPRGSNNRLFLAR